MKTSIYHISAAMLCLGTATPAIAEADKAIPVEFVEGANGGALEIADAFYGRSTPKRTAIVDLNGDGSAEILTRLTGQCEDAACMTTALMYRSNGWTEIFRDPTESLALGSPTATEPLVRIYPSDGTRWAWFGGRYIAGAQAGQQVTEIGTPQPTLSREEAASDWVRKVSSLQKFHVSPGKSVYSVLLVTCPPKLPSF